MPFRKQISKGVTFIFNHQNSDGGIPATNPGEPSGSWTTADVLLTFLTLGSFPKEYLNKLKGLTDFLIKSQLPDGSWEVVKGSGIESTMATGESVASLSLYKKVFGLTVPSLDKTIAKGLNWLRDNQNEKGVWGVEPKAGVSGKEFRMISTFYALKGLFEAGYTSDNSKNVKDAINFLMNVYNSKQKGWGGKEGLGPDSSNTARALTCLIRSKHTNVSSYIDNALKYLIKNKKDWNLNIEAYVTSTAHGETVFNSNTPYDLMEAFYYCEYKGDEVYDLIRFYLQIQEDDGKWYLASQNKIEKNITTWSTSEALIAIEQATIFYLPVVFSNWNKKIKPIWKYVSIFSFTIIVFLIMQVLGYYNYIYNYWSSLKDETKDKIIWGIGIALVVGIFTNLLTPFLKKIFSKQSKNEKAN